MARKEADTLRLTLSKNPFDVMVTSEKTEEFRDPSPWNVSRIVEREYRYVHFTNGYRSHMPWFLCQWRGWAYAQQAQEYRYSNGLLVQVNEGDLIVLLGSILQTGNLHRAR